MLHIAEKRSPPLLYFMSDTTWKFKEMFRDQAAARLDWHPLFS